MTLKLKLITSLMLAFSLLNFVLLALASTACGGNTTKDGTSAAAAGHHACSMRDQQQHIGGTITTAKTTVGTTMPSPQPSSPNDDASVVGIGTLVAFEQHHHQQQHQLQQRHRRRRRGLNNGKQQQFPSLGSTSVRRNVLTMSSKSGRRLVTDLMPPPVEAKAEKTNIFQRVKSAVVPASKQSFGSAIKKIQRHSVSLALEVVLAKSPEQMQKLKEVLKLALYYEQTLALFKATLVKEEVRLQNAEKKLNEYKKSNDGRYDKIHLDNQQRHVAKVQQNVNNFRATKRKIKENIDGVIKLAETDKEFSFANHLYRMKERKEPPALRDLLANWEKQKPLAWGRDQMRLWVKNHSTNEGTLATHDPIQSNTAHPLHTHAMMNRDNDRQLARAIDHLLMVDAAFDREARDECLKIAFAVPLRNWAAIAQNMEDDELKSYMVNPLKQLFLGLHVNFDEGHASTFTAQMDLQPSDEAPKSKVFKDMWHKFRNLVSPYASRDLKTHQKELEVKREQCEWGMLNAMTLGEREKAKECVKVSLFIQMFFDKVFSDETSQKMEESKKNIVKVKQELENAVKQNKIAHRHPRRRHGRSTDGEEGKKEEEKDEEEEDDEDDDDEDDDDEEDEEDEEEDEQEKEADQVKEYMNELYTVAPNLHYGMPSNFSHGMAPNLAHGMPPNAKQHQKGGGYQDSSSIKQRSGELLKRSNSTGSMKMKQKQRQMEAEERDEEEDEVLQEPMLRRNASTSGGGGGGGGGRHRPPPMPMPMPNQFSAGTYYDGYHHPAAELTKIAEEPSGDEYDSDDEHSGAEADHGHAHGHRLQRCQSQRRVEEKRAQLRQARQDWFMQNDGRRQSKNVMRENYYQLRNSTGLAMSTFSAFYKKIATSKITEKNRFFKENLTKVLDEAKHKNGIQRDLSPEEEIYALDLYLDKRTRQLFAAGPGQDFLRNLLYLSMQMTGAEIRECALKFAWFRGCSVRENPDTIEVNGSGVPSSRDAAHDDADSYDGYASSGGSSVASVALSQRSSASGNASKRRSGAGGGGTADEKINIFSNQNDGNSVRTETDGSESGNSADGTEQENGHGIMKNVYTPQMPLHISAPIPTAQTLRIVSRYARIAKAAVGPTKIGKNRQFKPSK